MNSLNLVSNENVWGVLCGWHQIRIGIHKLETIDVLILNKNIYNSHLATTTCFFTADNFKVLFFLVGRNVWDWCSGGVNRLQQCDICWCCWSETLHTGQSAQARHYAWNVTAWILSISSCFVSIWLIFCRCVLNVKKLEFLYIWQTAMVRHMYIQVISFLIFFSCYLCFKYDDTFVTLHLHTANTDQWFLSS